MRRGTAQHRHTRHPRPVRDTTARVYSGEEFRAAVLEPALKQGEALVINLGGVAGYGRSFREKVFGGIVQALKRLNKEQVNQYLKIESLRQSWGRLQI